MRTISVLIKSYFGRNICFKICFQMMVSGNLHVYTFSKIGEKSILEKKKDLRAFSKKGMIDEWFRISICCYSSQSHICCWVLNEVRYFSFRPDFLFHMCINYFVIRCVFRDAIPRTRLTKSSCNIQVNRNNSLDMTHFNKTPIG